MTYSESFESLGDYLFAVHQAEINGVDRRLDFVASSGLESGVPSSGGFLLPDEYADDLHERTYETGSILSRCLRWPSTKEKFIIPMVDDSTRADGSRYGGVVMNWTEAGEAITASKPKFASREITRRKLSGLVYITNEMMADVPTVEAIFTRIFALEGSFIIENQIINGGGAIGPLGILNSDCLITVSKDSGQVAATITASNVINMLARLWSPSLSRAVWLINQDALPQLLSLTLGSGTAVVSLFSYSPTGDMLLAGRPIIPVEYCPTLGTTGDIILADLSEYMIASPDQIDMRHSGDLRFVNDESAFRVRMRVDGHPAWASPTTPLNGTATVSPFVALETRS